MGRQKTVSDKAILQAAREAIIEHGSQVSTTVIAERLGLSQSAIFKRFGTKEDLVTAALKPDPPDWLGELTAGPDERPIDQQLRELSERISLHLREELPIVMAMHELGLNPMSLMKKLEDEPASQIHHALTAWLEQARDQGRLKRFDPKIVCTTLLASLHAAEFTRVVGLSSLAFDDHDAFLDEVIALIWYAVRP